jgi:phage FluMu gp28-like protein
MKKTNSVPKQSTKDLIEGMMKDAKLTPYQMKQVTAHINEQRPLPKKIAIDKTQESNNMVQEMKEKYGNNPSRSNIFGEKNYKAIPKRKTVKQMLAEDAFARDSFKPAPPSTTYSSI